jgi:hypothetical protein
MSLPAGDGESYPTGDERCPPGVNPGTSEISSDPGTLGETALTAGIADFWMLDRDLGRAPRAVCIHHRGLDQRLAPTDFDGIPGGSWGGVNLATWVLQGLPEPDCGRPHYASPCRR